MITSLGTKRRQGWTNRIPGGRAAWRNFVVEYFFGPLLLDEFNRVSTKDVEALRGENGREGQGSELRDARFSLVALSKALVLDLEAGKVLPLPLSRNKGETRAYHFSFHRVSLRRLYDQLYHSEGGIAHLRLLTEERWPQLIQFAFKFLGPSFQKTTAFETLLANASTISAALGFLLVDQEIRDLAIDGAFAGIVESDAPDGLFALETRTHLTAGWIFALAVALHHRKGSGAAMTALRATHVATIPDAMDDVLWAFYPEYRSSKPYELYRKMLRGETINVSKPGPKPRSTSSQPILELDSLYRSPKRAIGSNLLK